jgi:hypothetical protein
MHNNNNNNRYCVQKQNSKANYNVICIVNGRNTSFIIGFKQEEKTKIRREREEEEEEEEENCIQPN